MARGRKAEGERAAGAGLVLAGGDGGHGFGPGVAVGLDDLRHEGTLEVVAAGVCLMSEEAYEWTSGQDRLLAVATYGSGWGVWDST